MLEWRTDSWIPIYSHIVFLTAYKNPVKSEELSKFLLNEALTPLFVRRIPGHFGAYSVCIACFWYFKNLLHWNLTWPGRNQNIQKASMGDPLQSFLISSWSDKKHGHHGQLLFLIGWYFRNLFLWNHLAKWNQTIQEASMGNPLQTILISPWSSYKYGHHRLFLIMIGWYFKTFLLWNHMLKCYNARSLDF